MPDGLGPVSYTHLDVYKRQGAESQAHAPNEITWKQDLVTCAAVYAAVPGLYKEENKTADVSQFRATLTDNDIK